MPTIILPNVYLHFSYVYHTYIVPTYGLPSFFLPNVCLHFSYLMYAYIYHTQCLHTFSLPNAYLHLPFSQEERKILDFWVLQLTTCSTFTYILFGTRYAFVISVTLSSSPCKQHSYKRSFSISSPPKKNFCFSLYMIFLPSYALPREDTSHWPMTFKQMTSRPRTIESSIGQGASLSLAAVL